MDEIDDRGQPPPAMQKKKKGRSGQPPKEKLLYPRMMGGHRESWITPDRQLMTGVSEMCDEVYKDPAHTVGVIGCASRKD
jgi:hypothetical protein